MNEIVCDAAVTSLALKKLKKQLLLTIFLHLKDHNLIETNHQRNSKFYFVT